MSSSSPLSGGWRRETLVGDFTQHVDAMACTRAQSHWPRARRSFRDGGGGSSAGNTTPVDAAADAPRFFAVSVQVDLATRTYVC